MFNNGQRLTKKTKGHITAYMKLRQGQKYEDFYVTPSGLMARMMGADRKSFIPKSLRQQILKKCHDVPFTSHVGMCKTLQLVDRKFHWRGLRGDTIQYVKTCPTCQMMKSDNRGKGQVTVTPGNSLKKMGSCNHGPRH